MIHFHLTAHGIGDAVCGLYAACGAADAGHPVTFHCRRPEFLAVVSHPGVTVKAWEADVGIDANADYWGQLEAGAAGTCPSRAQWYCDKIATSLGIPPFAPKRPQSVDRPPPVIPPGYVLIAPYSHRDGGRDWHGWPEVAAKLAPKRVVVVGENSKRPKLRRLFRGCEVYWDRSAAWLVSAVANADHVYGNDSGVVHLAGLHSVPATAVVAHLPGEFLFAEAPTVRAVSPKNWPCAPCGWQGHRGWRRECATACAAMASVGVGRVALPVLLQHELDTTLGVRQERLVGAGE